MTLQQIIDTAKIHPFIVYDSNGDEATTLTEPICNYRVNGGTVTLFTPTISAYNTTMKSFLVTIPDTLADAIGDSVEICISGPEGIAHLLINIVMSQATLTAIETRLGVLELTGGTHTGSDSVIPPTNYTLDASAKTITLTTPYDTLAIEQVIEIFNLSKTMLIYDSHNPRANSSDGDISISIADGVITYQYSGTMANTDKLMITVNVA